METNHPYISPTSGQFPLIGTGPSPEERMPSAEDFDNMLKCGLNATLLTGLTGPDSEPEDYENGLWKQYYQEAFKVAEESQINIIVNSTILAYERKDEYSVGNWRKRLVESFKNEPLLGGWQIRDEPQYSEWEKEINKKENDNGENDNGEAEGNGEDNKNEEKTPLLKGYDEIYALDPNHIVTINLAAATDSITIGTCKDYNEYLSNFQNVFKPAVWSYDYYSVRTRPGGKNYVQYDTLFEYLNTFASISKSTGRPFWAYCLVSEHTTGGAIYPFPTEGIIRFQAFVSLGFGAQGLVFWSYRPPKDGNGIHYIICPVTDSGEKTEVWYNLQTVLKEIKNCIYIFNGCKIIKNEVSQIEEWTSFCAPLQKVKYNTKGILASQISNNGKNYLLIVSLDPFSEQELEIHHTNRYPDTEIGKPFTPVGPISPGDTTGNSNIEKRIVKPGGFIIYEII